MMTLYRGELVIDDSNWQSQIGDGKQVFAGGEPRYLSAIPQPKDLNTSGYARAFGDALQVIPRSEWSARLKEQIEKKARVSDFCDFKPLDQNGTNFCWANGPCTAATIIRRMQGLPYKEVSAASIAAPIKGYRNVGGWEADAVEYMAQHGATTSDKWPNAAISRQYDTPETQADRLNYKALEWIDLGSNFDRYATACLLGFPCPHAYNWMSHVMCVVDLVEIEAGSFGLRVRNSWGDWGTKNDLGFAGFQVYREGRGTPDSGFALRSFTSYAGAA